MATRTDTYRLLINTRGDVRGLDEVRQASEDTESAWDRMGKTVGITGDTLRKGVVAGAAALVGTGLVSYLNDSVRAFVESGEAAAQFARGTNASTEEAGKFVTLAQAMGLSMNDLLEINAEFQSTIGDTPELLDDLGVSVARNADGSENWTLTLVDTIDALGEMENGADAARLAVEIFGEEGSKQLASLYLGGIDVSEAFDRIQFNANSQQAQEFNAAMFYLNTSLESLKITVGSALVPALTSLLDVVTPLVSALGALPGDVYLVVGAAALLHVGLTRVNISLTALAARAVIAGAALTSMRTMALLATAAMQRLGAVIAANPIGAALTLLTLAYVGLRSAQDAASDSARAHLDELRALEAEGMSTAAATEQLGQQMADSASNMEKFGFALNDISAAEFLVLGPVTLLTDSLFGTDDAARGATKALQELRDEQGEYAVVTSVAAESTQDLQTAVAEFLSFSDAYATSWEDIGAAAGKAADAQAEAEKATNLADIAMGLYASSIQQVVEWSDRLAGQTVDVEEALNDAQEATKTLADTKDDLSTWGDETVIAASKAEQAYLDYVAALAAQGLPEDFIVGELRRIRDEVGPEAQAILDRVIAQVSGKENEIPIQLTPTMPPLTELNGLANTLVGAIAPESRTVPLVTVVDQGSRNTAEAELDATAEQRDAVIRVDSRRGPEVDRYISSVADTSRDAVIRVDSRRGPEVDSYIDSIAYQYRPAYIDVVVRGAGAAQSRVNSINSIQGMTATAAAAATSAPPPQVTQTITVNVRTDDLPALFDRVAERATVIR